MLVSEGKDQTYAFCSLHAVSGISHWVMIWSPREYWACINIVQISFWYHAQYFSFHIQDGATEILSHQPLLTVDDLADQVAEVLDHFKYAPVALVVLMSLLYSACEMVPNTALSTTLFLTPINTYVTLGVSHFFESYQFRRYSAVNLWK